MLKVLFISIATLILLTLIFLFFLGNKSKSGKSPGFSTEALLPCPDKPNCVCSENPEDVSHYVKPLHYSGVSAEEAWKYITETIEETGGKIIIGRETYLAATYSVSVFGFIDDVECRLDSIGQTIHIRSAARIGVRDLGVNRKRVARIIHRFNQNMK